MIIQTRREFLKKLGWMFAGGILVPYIPKIFYSIPKEIAKLDVAWCGPSSFSASQIDGSIGKPFRSLQMAIDRIAPNGTVYVIGNHSETIGGPVVVDKPITISGQNQMRRSLIK